MKKFTAIIPAIIVYSIAGPAQTKIPTQDAGKHLEETLTICSKKLGGRLIKKWATQLTLLNVAGAFPSHLLTMLINYD